MRYKLHKPINRVYKLWHKLTLNKLHMVLVLTALATLFYLLVATIQYVRLTPAQRMIAINQRQTDALLATNSFSKNIFLRSLGASNNSRLKLWFVSAHYNQIGQPNLDKQVFEQKVKDKNKTARFLAEVEAWEAGEQMRQQSDTFGRLGHAITLAEAVKNYAKTNPNNLNHEGLVKLNAVVQDDKTIGMLQSERTIRNISARLLAEHEHYQSFKDKARWASRSKDLKLELSTALDQDWQNWLATQKAELENYKYLLNNLSAVTD